MATQNILFIKHEQFLKLMEERISAEGMDINVLRIMHDYLAQKRKTPWTINHEKIFFLYVNVCVAVDETESIKETLTQYKFLTQVAYSSSLESVLIHIRSSLEGLFKDKISAFKNEEVINCGDIESEEVEQDLLTGFLSIDAKKKEIEIKKIFRQLMEGYRIVIDTARVHKKLEEVNAQTVEKVLELCLKYNRKRELKRFLDAQHVFLDRLQQREVDFQKNPNHINLFNSETRDYLIKVRLDCVDYALRMGFYQQAFAQLEDVSILLNLRKVTAPIKQRMLSSYYLYLSKVFWNSKYYNYHSFFLYHHLLVYRTNPNASQAEVQAITDELLLGILSVPQNALENTQYEEQRTKIAMLQKNSNKHIPKKEEIINMVLRMNLNEIASEPVNALFTLALNEINIFSVAKKVEPIFKFLNENPSYARHIRPIEENLINRVLFSVSKVYKTLKIDNLYRFLSFSVSATVDTCLQSASAANQLSCRIDQQKRVIIFNPTKAKNDYVNASASIASLAQAAKLISESLTLDGSDGTQQTARVESAQQFLKDSKEVLKVRSEEILRYLILKEKSTNQEKGKREHEDKINEEKERLRKVDEYNRKLEEKRLREAVDAQQLKQKMEIRAEIIKIKGNQTAKIEGIKIENMTEEDLRPIELETMFELKKNIQEALKEQQENKYKKAFTKIDYTERETRKYEQEKIKAIIEKSNAKLEDHVEKAQTLFQQELAKKKVLSAAKEFKDNFFKSLLEERKQEYQNQLKEFKFQIEKEFKENILEQAYQNYKEDKVKKEEEEKLQKELQQQQLLEKIRNQTSEQQQEESGWRIVRENDQAPPTFDDFYSDKTKTPADDAPWRSGEIVKSEPQNTRGFNSGFASGESEKMTRNTNNLASVREVETDNAWRTTAVKPAIAKPAENAPFKFQNTKKFGDQPSNPAFGQPAVGNPNDVIKRNIGGAPQFSNPSRPQMFSSNKPASGNPSSTPGNPNTSTGPFSTNRFLNSKTPGEGYKGNNNTNNNSSNTGSWRKN